MKKFIVASIVALTVALVGAASANAAFNTNLTVGSTGSDVSALQSWLISKGFNIPSIASGAATPGYFGQQTKTAVIAYQASVGLPTTGFVGPLTRGMLNGSSTVTSNTTVSCPAGYTCTANAGTVTTPVTTGTVVNDGTDGSVTASLSTYTSNATIKKGETKDMVAVKLQATAGPVSVTRFDARFNVRPWLYFSKITLSDSQGNVIATKNLSGSADATEITVGSDYLVRFEGVNTTVTPGTDKTLVVSGTVLSTTDKLTSDVSVIVSVPDNAIRTTNGKGYTDSIGLGTVALSGTSGRTVTLSSSGSTGNILGRISPTTPSTRIVTTSTNGETTGVVLGEFDFKSENRDSTINTLKFTLQDNGLNKPWSTILKRIYIVDGSTTYQVDSVATSSVFSNLTIKLPQDQWKTVVLKADVADQDDFSNGAMASSSITLSTTNVVGIDSNYTTVTTGTNTVTSNDVTFLQNGITITGVSSTAVLDDNGTSKSRTATVGYTFTVNNTGTNDVYISATTTALFAIAPSTATSTVSALIDTAVPGNVAGDSSASYYRVPSGSSRTFHMTGTLSNAAGTPGVNSAYATKVYFSDNTTWLQKYSVNFGLETFKSPAISI